MNEFLLNLQKAVETGEFNSEAAKKINKINEIADNVNVDAVKEKLEKIEIQPVTEEEAALANSEYEKKMEEIRIEDVINKELAILIEIEDLVKLTIGDMLGHLNVLTDSYLENNKEVPDVLFARIKELQSTYEPIVKANSYIISHEE